MSFRWITWLRAGILTLAGLLVAANHCTLHAEDPSAKAAAELDRLLAEELFQKLPASNQLAPRTSDEIFLRRIYLDLVGQPPTPNEVKQFAAISAQDKRSDQIAALLKDPRFGANAAHYWREVLRARAQNAGEGPSIQIGPFESWLTGQFNDNVPWDQIVRSFLEAKGPVRDHGEAAVFLAQRFAPVGVAGEVSRIFLGIQIQCAECHNHPTDRWKRQQFHEFAAFFPRVGMSPFERAKGARRESQVASFDDAPQVRPIRMRFAGVPEYFMPDLKDPSVPGAMIAPAFFLSGQRLETGAPDAQRRKSLGEWLTARDNPWFAKAYVNRLWAELVGEGFYEPVDDMGPDRTCSAPQTLDYLAAQFAAHSYDIKWLYNTIALTQAYQRESRPRRKPWEAPFTANVPQPLRADPLGRVLSQAVGVEIVGSRLSPSGETVMLLPIHTLFGYDPSSRREEIASTIPQVLMLMNSEVVNKAITASNNDSPLAKLLAATESDDEVTTNLYLQALARKPSERELEVCLKHIKKSNNRGEAFEDLLWSRANSEELRYRN